MKTVFWLLVAIGIVYAFYSGAVAVWQYFEIKGIVEESVVERAKSARDARVMHDVGRWRAQTIATESGTARHWGNDCT